MFHSSHKRRRQASLGTRVLPCRLEAVARRMTNTSQYPAITSESSTLNASVSILRHRHHLRISDVDLSCTTFGTLAVAFIMLRLYNLLIAVLLSLLTLQASGKKEKPDIKSNPFKSTPSNVIYFEDSDIILVTTPNTGTTYRSADGGESWKPLKGVEEGQVFEILRHPYNKKVAVVLGSKKTHWMTKDRGESWQAFTTPEHPSTARMGISFHASDADRMLFHAQKCESLFCEDMVYYTTDGFDSKPKLLKKDVASCIWAKTTDIFTTGDEKLDRNMVLCIARGEFDLFNRKNRVLMSSDYFDQESIEPKMSDGRSVEGVINLAATKRYIVFAARSSGTTELAMYVTNSTSTWHRAEFGEHKLEEDAYTLLESTNYSMQVDVMTSAVGPMGVLLTSESNGTFFTKNIEHTNRNTRGFVDFEKVSNIQGLVMVNTVDNWEDVEHSLGAVKKLKSKISFDDGRTWDPMKVETEELHLHSVTEQRNVGRIFSSPAPGIAMGIGNTGNYLKSYEEGDLFLSIDAGLNWRKVQKQPHLYEFGASGSVLVAIAQDETDEIKWSLDYGHKWKTTKLDDKVKPYLLTTTPDSTSLKFLMIATKGAGSELSYYVYSIDFDGLHERKCKSSDLEKWPARVGKHDTPSCIMGHKQFFLRRKLDAKCLVVVEDFEDPEQETEDCPCTEADFECDYNFNRVDGECVPIGAVPAPEGACSSEDGKFKGPSGYRMIPGNTCIRKDGIELDKKEKEWDCSVSKVPAKKDGISSEIQKFDGDQFVQYYYLERVDSNKGDDETIIMRTNRREVWLTKDHGKKWKKILEDEDIVAIYPHEFINENVYMLTPTEKVFYSKDRGETIHDFKAPNPPNRNNLQVLAFHPKEKDWLIWTGGKDCSSFTGNCVNAAYITTHGGEKWEPLLSSVRKCQFVYREDRQGSDQLVYCEQYEKEALDSPIVLLSSDDWFDHKKELKRDVINFATMAEYIVVAVRDDDEASLKVDTSIDGVQFADAHFPKNFVVPHQQAYTVLDSSTHAVFLHVTVNAVRGQEYGSIIKSNSNGISYVLSTSEVNRNPDGYVDFEKMQGLEGVAIINRVANAKETSAGSAKKLKTYITHNDGAGWALLSRPEDPPKSKGDPFECQGTNDKCSLHLHGYTERKDPRDSFSSPSAVGLMLGTGNVGEYLGFKKEADTFITTDGGMTWKFIRKGNWMWEFGDQGSIIVLVKEDEPTDRVLYSLNEGKDWAEYTFTEGKMVVTDITTVPSDTSRNFLLWGKLGGDIVTVNLDFSGLPERSEQCNLDEQNPNSEKGDYYLWSPKHPLSDDDCLFGHVAQYHRKKLDRDCWNGKEIPHLHAISRNCTCTREDFECDYNYEPGADGQCNLVPGVEKPDPETVCEKNPELEEYNEVTGYRRIPLTTCQGGRELDQTSRKYPCPGHQEEFEKKHSISGIGLFFAIILPIVAAAGVGYWVWQNWDNKFGRIRLGDGGYLGTGPGDPFDRDAPWIKYPVLAISGLVAVVAALPMVIGSIIRMITTRVGRSGGSSRGGFNRPYTSRSSFQRSRGNYAVVDPDEGELLGEDSDEEGI